jgi:hypothetical protein
MRWETYNQAAQKFDRYNATLFQGANNAAERYLSRLNSEGWATYFEINSKREAR